MRNTEEKKNKKNAETEQNKKLDSEKGLKGKAFWATLFPYMKPYRHNIILAMVFSLLTGFCVALQPFVIKFIVDTGIGGDPIELFGKELFRFGADATKATHMTFVVIAVGVYVCLSILRVSSWGFGLSNMLKALEGTLFTLRSRFFGHVQRMCMHFSDKNSSGELYNYIMGSPMANIKAYLHSLIQSVPYQAVALVISLVALCSYSWKLTILIVATAIAMALINYMARAKIRRASQTFLTAEKETSKYITDILHGSEAVKMYSIEQKTIERFENYISNLKDSGIHYTMSTFMTSVRIEMMQYLGTALVYLLGGFLCLDAGYGFLACLFYFCF